MQKKKRFQHSPAVSKSSSNVDKVFDESGKQPEKLTKQQKRDKRRNALAKLASSSHSTDDLKTDVAPASVQKSSVYKRKAVYPPLYITDELTRNCSLPADRFLNESDSCFGSIVDFAYQGFEYSPRNTFAESFHEKFEHAMIGLEEEGKYQFDVTQPAGLGTKTAITFVTRCVVGDPGTTYKYLGLRMFSIPWTPGVVGSSEHSVQIGHLNKDMIERSQQLLSERGGEVGSCQYNLTLINRCYPSNHSKILLKDEPIFKKDKCTVSWHADSTLEHYSTIGVYHVTTTNEDSPSFKNSDKCSKNSKKRSVSSLDGNLASESDSSWRIAMRVFCDAEGPNLGKPSSRAGEMKNLDTTKKTVPPIAFALPSKSAYFLLDDFNHHHQHSVMAGSTHRYASTHRVCRTDGHTFQSIKAQCSNILQQKAVYTTKYMRGLLTTSNILEFEWIRQYYIQGSQHRHTHPYWEEAMLVLLSMWNEMRVKINLALEVLRDAAAGSCLRLDNIRSDTNCNRHKKQKAKQLIRVESVESGSYSVVHQLLVERSQKRKDWHARQVDPIFEKLPPQCRPQDPPLPPYESSADETVPMPYVAASKNSAAVTLKLNPSRGDSVTMTPVNVSKLADDGTILKMQDIFDSK